MSYCIFALSSLTYAYKGEDALHGAGIRSKIVRLDGTETKNGCRYGIAVSPSDCSAASNVLRRSGVKYGDVLR